MPTVALGAFGIALAASAAAAFNGLIARQAPAWGVLGSDSDAAARRVFRFTIIDLSLLFAALLVDQHFVP